MELCAGTGISAGKERHLVAETDEFVDQPGNHAFCATIKFWGNAFSQGCYLRNTHVFRIRRSNPRPCRFRAWQQFDLQSNRLRRSGFRVRTKLLKFFANLLDRTDTYEHGTASPPVVVEAPPPVVSETVVVRRPIVVAPPVVVDEYPVYAAPRAYAAPPLYAYAGPAWRPGWGYRGHFRGGCRVRKVGT